MSIIKIEGIDSLPVVDEFASENIRRMLLTIGNLANPFKNCDYYTIRKNEAFTNSDYNFLKKTNTDGIKSITFGNDEFCIKEKNGTIAKEEICFVEFYGGIDLNDLTNNGFLLTELKTYDIKHLAYFGSEQEKIINAIGCSDRDALEKMITRGIYDENCQIQKYSCEIFDVHELNSSLNFRLQC